MADVPSNDIQRRWLPVFAIVLASVCFSVLALSIRELTFAGVPTFEIIVVRGAAQVVISLLILMWLGQPWHTWMGQNFTEVKWLTLRAVVGFGGAGFNFLGISYLPLAESQILGQLLPVYAPIIAWLILGEEWYAAEMASAMLGLCGVFLIARPAAVFGDQVPMSGQLPVDDSMRYRGVACCMIATFCAALSFVIVRLLGTRVKVHWACVMLYQAIGQVVLAALFLKAFQVPVMPSMLTSRSVALALAAGLLGSLGQMFNTWGMQREKTATASLVQKGLSPFFGFFNQVMFLPGDPVYWTTIAGFCVTGVSLVVTSLGKWSRERKEVQLVKESEGYLPLLASEDSARRARASGKYRGGGA